MARLEHGVSEPVPPGLDTQALMALGVALDRLGAGSVRGFAEAAFLVRAFPQWAICRQAGGRLRIAVPVSRLEAAWTRGAHGVGTGRIGCRAGRPDAS